MKKYIYEVGVDIQTLYVYPHANNVEEAEKLGYQMAIDEYSLIESNYDITPSFVQISDMTQEYKSKLNSNTKELISSDDSDEDFYSDGEVLDILFDDTGTKNTADLIKLVKKCCSSLSNCDNAHRGKK